jgi:hypothetical protein
MDFVVPDLQENLPNSGQRPADESSVDRNIPGVSRERVTPEPEPDQNATVDGEPSPTDLFDLYEKIAEARPGSRDAEIFEKIREWTFSDFSQPPHEFAGITGQELRAWQKRHRINLSSGRIRPDPVDIQRGHAWGHIRLAARANSLHGEFGPPSAEELILMDPKQRPLEVT